MGNILLLFLVLFPMLLSAWVFPLRRRDRRYRNWLIQIIPAVELAAALLLLPKLPDQQRRLWKRNQHFTPF